MNAVSYTELAGVVPQAAGVPRAKQMLERARWAARSFATFDRASTQRIVAAVADAAESHAEKYAEWAVRETGFGVAADKVVKNRLCSRGIADAYRDHDFVTPRIDTDRRIVEVPRPAGVVLALTPSTNPVSTVYFKVLLALMTRNAVVVSPHPLAKECCADAARVLGEAAVAAGAPDGVVQVVEEPSVPLVEALMADERTDVILATGGVAMVRAAYSSGNPAIGVGPGNVPVLVDASADLAKAAERLVGSKAFDNSVLCTNESVLVVEEAVADRFLRELSRHGAHVLDDADRDKVRDTVFPQGRFDTSLVGAVRRPTSPPAPGCRVAPRTRRSWSRRSTSRSTRSRSPTRSSARCWASSAPPPCTAASAPPRRCCASVAPGTRPSCTAPTPRSSCSTPRRSTCCGSPSTRAARPGSAGFDTEPGAVDDDRHRLHRRGRASARTSSRSTCSTRRASPTTATSARSSRTSTGIDPWVAPPPATPPYPRASNDRTQTPVGRAKTQSVVE